VIATLDKIENTNIPLLSDIPKFTHKVKKNHKKHKKNNRIIKFVEKRLEQFQPDETSATRNSMLLLNLVEEAKHLIQNNVLNVREIDILTNNVEQVEEEKKELKDKIKDTTNYFKKEMVKQEKRFAEFLRKKEKEFDDEMAYTKRKYEEQILEKEYMLHDKDSYYPMLFEMEKIKLDEKLLTANNKINESDNKRKILTKEIEELRDLLKERNFDYNNLLKEFRNRFSEFSTILDINDQHHFDRIINQDATDPDKIEEINNIMEYALSNNYTFQEIKQSLLNAGYTTEDIELSIENMKN